MKNKNRNDIRRADKAYLQDNNIDFPTLNEHEIMHLTKTQKKTRIRMKIHKLVVEHRQATIHSSSNPIIPPDAITTTTSTTAAMKVMVKQNMADDNHKNNGTGRDDYDDRNDDRINLLPSAKKKQRTCIQAKARARGHGGLGLDADAWISFLFVRYTQLLHAELREKETEIKNLKDELHSFQLELPLQPESYNVKKEQVHKDDEEQEHKANWRVKREQEH